MARYVNIKYKKVIEEGEVNSMWEQLPEEQKEEYKKMILVFASITEMFAQKAENNTILAPIINSKYQETVFQKVFKATAEDIGNTSYDVALITDTGEKYLIGIKTFGIASGSQKIAQFKAKHDEWSSLINAIEKNAYGKYEKERIDQANNKLYFTLAKKISLLRNQRIESSAANIRGFNISNRDIKINSVYHVLMPSPKGVEPKIYVGELPYDKIDIDHIEIIGCTSARNPANFSFTDGKHIYRYTAADSQLLMDFKNKEIVKESWDVKYVDDAYRLFSDLASDIQNNNMKLQYEIKNDIIESYSWILTDHIEKYSGFNSFFGVGSKIGIDQRKDRINKLKVRFKDCIPEKELQDILKSISEFLLTKVGSKDERNEKVILRDKIMQRVLNTENIEFIEEVRKLVYRPKNEMYIPILHARDFHERHPNFFGNGIAKFKENSNKLLLPKEKRKFDLVFEPSGDTISAFITQDNGKAIESYEKQSLLGEWIREGVFQLKEYEPLTDDKLQALGINGIRLYKKKNISKVYLEFIWIDKNDPPDDLFTL